MVRFSHLVLGILGVQGDEDLDNDIRLTSCQAQVFTMAGYTVDPSIVTDVDCEEDDARALLVNHWNIFWDNYWRPEENKYIVPYYFAAGYPGDAAKIRAKLKDFEQNTCIKLEETDAPNDWTNRLKIISDSGCWSYVGRRFAGDQELSLRSGGCEGGMIPLHEAMHALGFWHEQQREDRDNHVIINPALVTDINYARMDTLGYSQDTTLPSAYDFTSIMHYGGWMHGGVPNIAKVATPNTPAYAEYGDNFSAADIAQMRYAYPCDTNECKEGTHQCHAYAKCVNDPSGYHCECFPGLNGDGLTTGTGCDDVDECANGSHNCGQKKCYNTPGSFRCSQVIEIVWTVDGTGSYKGSYNTQTAKANFKLQRDYLSGLNNGLEFRLGLTFFSDRWFASDEMTKTSPDQYALGISLTDVSTLSDATIDHAFDTILRPMWYGGDLPEDVLSAIVFTRTDPNLGWSTDSIKQLHVFTDVIFHHKGCGHYTQYTETPPLTQWTTQPASMYAYHDKTIVSAWTIGWKHDSSTGWYPDASGIIDQIYFNVAGCTSSCQALYDTTFTEIPVDINNWVPLPYSRSSLTTKSFTRGVITATNIAEQFEKAMEKIEEIVEETVNLIENVNECALALHDCDYNARCDDDVDGWACTCNDGWFGNGKICDDVDVCGKGTHGCGAHSTCVNGIGMSYDCVCDTGYAPNSGGSCIDINECDADTSDDSGPDDAGPGRRRRDVFSSGVGSDAPAIGCAPNSKCINTDGSYYCQCESMFRDESVENDGSLCKGPFCKAEYVSMAGYDDIRMGDDDDVCYDIDECSAEWTGDTCEAVPNSHCENNAGGFTCPCNHGYHDEDGACVETNECEMGMDNCHDHALCTNTIGSWTCKCDRPWKGDGVTCFKKHNRWRLAQLENRLPPFIASHFSESFPRFSTRMQEKFKKIFKKINSVYERWDAMCDLPQEEYEEDDDARALLGDPCRGTFQLTRNIAEWANKWTIPCGDKAHREPVFADRIQRMMDNLREKMQDKAGCECKNPRCK